MGRQRSEELEEGRSRAGARGALGASEFRPASKLDFGLKAVCEVSADGAARGSQACDSLAGAGEGDVPTMREVWGEALRGASMLRESWSEVS